MFQLKQALIVVCFLIVKSLIGGSSADDAGQNSFMPMVAFLCRRPAMHLTEAGWKNDDQIDCLTDPNDILEYCKHVYPNLDVRYVVEASDVVKISNWCKSGRDKCNRHSHSVRPFRCLVKPFISDALLVPKNCIFDHIHESSQCKGYSDWDVTAGLSCTERGMSLKSFAMIQPCEVNKFAGTEFVCCPGNYNEDGKKDSGQIVVVDKKQNFGKNRKIEEKSHKFFNSSEKIKNVEHKNENKIEEKMTDGHKKHVKKAVKQLYKSKHISMVAKLRAVSVTTTQTPREPVVMVKKSNIEIEKQLKNLDEQKKLALENYLKSLNEDPISVARILSTLKKYVKIKQKERVHAVENFKNSLNGNHGDDDGKDDLERTEKKLKEIDQATEEALQMLENIPKHGKKMKQHMEDYILNLPAVDNTILKRGSPSSPSTTSFGQPTPLSSLSSSGLSSYPVTNTLELKTMRKTSLPVTSSSSSSSSPSSSSSQSSSSSSPITMKQHVIGHQFEPIPAHMGRNQLNIEQPHLKKVPGKTNTAYLRHNDNKMTNPVGIILTSIGLVLIVVIGIVALIKRVNSVPVTNGYLDKPPKRGEGLRKSSLVSNSGASVRRQNSMNGYENPTYRYFEAQVNP